MQAVSLSHIHMDKMTHYEREHLAIGSDKEGRSTVRIMKARIQCDLND